jgi:aspartyl-tRNA synthetase
VEKVFCVGRSTELPIQLADCSRSEEDFKKDPSLVKVSRDTRLDNRIIDLRTVANQGIMRIQSGVCMLFREFLLKNDFTEIHSPKLIGGSSEGGADIFKLDYFGSPACLAQSPQLYKQMALMTDLGRVFEIGPVFRAEKSFTHRHLCEFTGLDMEMTFMEHYEEVLDVLDSMFNHIFDGLNERFKPEIEAVQAQYPFTPMKYKSPCLRLTFAEAVKLLREKGPKYIEKQIAEAQNDNEVKQFKQHLESVKSHDEEEDIGTADERILGKVIHDEYGEDFYIINKFPLGVRPFYTMPDPNDSRWANAYDFFMRGEEIVSGAQRIHDPQLLTERASSMGIDVASIQPYVDAFKYGAYPHAGAGVGMERVVMLFLQLENIRMTSMFPRDPHRLSP